MTYKVAPSMMCCNLLNVKDQINMFEQQEIDMLHIDIMDGSFVPNIALGACFVEQLKKGTRLPLDLHFMIDSPERYINTYPISEGDYVSIHFESTNHVQRALQAVKNKGAKALVAINPATPIYAVIEVLDDIDGVLIMNVNPGYAGQKMIPRSIEKIKAMRKFLDENGRPDAEIEVDGNVSIENAIKMRTAGANILVLGTAMQSKKEGFSAEDIKQFKETVK